MHIDHGDMETHKKARDQKRGGVLGNESESTPNSQQLNLKYRCIHEHKKAKSPQIVPHPYVQSGYAV